MATSTSATTAVSSAVTPRQASYHLPEAAADVLAAPSRPTPRRSTDRHQAVELIVDYSQGGIARIITARPPSHSSSPRSMASVQKMAANPSNAASELVAGATAVGTIGTASLLSARRRTSIQQPSPQGWATPRTAALRLPHTVAGSSSNDGMVVVEFSDDNSSSTATAAQAAAATQPQRPAYNHPFQASSAASAPRPPAMGGSTASTAAQAAAAQPQRPAYNHLFQAGSTASSPRPSAAEHFAASSPSPHLHIVIEQNPSAPMPTSPISSAEPQKTARTSPRPNDNHCGAVHDLQPASVEGRTSSPKPRTLAAASSASPVSPQADGNLTAAFPEIQKQNRPRQLAPLQKNSSSSPSGNTTPSSSAPALLGSGRISSRSNGTEHPSSPSNRGQPSPSLAAQPNSSRTGAALPLVPPLTLVLPLALPNSSRQSTAAGQPASPASISGQAGPFSIARNSPPTPSSSGGVLLPIGRLFVAVPHTPNRASKTNQPTVTAQPSSPAAAISHTQPRDLEDLTSPRTPVPVPGGTRLIPPAAPSATATVHPLNAGNPTAPTTTVSAASATQPAMIVRKRSADKPSKRCLFFKTIGRAIAGCCCWCARVICCKN